MIKKLQPKLRFRGFTDAWEQRKLGTACSFKKGQGYSKKDVQASGLPLLLYGQMYTNYSSIISDTDTFAEERPNSIRSTGQEVVIPASGETQEDIAIASAVVTPGILYGGDLNILAPHDYLNPVFLALTVTGGPAHRLLAEKAQGKTIVHLRGNDIAQTCIAYPSMDEQRHIANLFTKLEQLIAAEKRKLNFLKDKKTALLQQIFNRKLRSKDHDDSWEPRKLGDVATLVKKRNKKLDVLHVYTISAERGVIPQTDYFERNIVSKGRLGNYLIVNHDDFIYNPRISSEAPYGPVRRNDNLDKGVVSPLYTVFSIQNAYPLFIEYFFKSDIWHQFMQLNGNVGARSDRFAINDLSLMEMPIYLPELKEQKVIGNLFKKLDELISCEEKRIKLLAGKKSALMNQMFI